METHVVSLQKKPIRLQEYGLGIFVTITTRSALKKAIKKGLVFVDGKVATTAIFIHGNEVITYNKPPEISDAKEIVFDLEVLYEDDYLAIIHKPAGILVSGNKFKTVANALPQNLKKSKQPDVVLPRPVHRLDYPTTGLLLVGKTSASILALNKLFENKEISKTYFAVTIGEMKERGIVKIPIDGKASSSLFEVLKTVPSERFQYLNLVKLTPLTGRRHQLRRHMAAIGSPILGDKEYGKSHLILNGKGLYLHAYSLVFTHPFTKEKIAVKKELAAKFTKLFGTE